MTLPESIDWSVLQDPSNQKTAAAVIGGAGALAALGYWYKRRSHTYKRTPSSFQLTGGAVDAAKIKDTVRAAWPRPRASAHLPQLFPAVQSRPAV